jgi:hypothetical protein
LGARVTVALIVQKALSKLYSPQASVDSWERIQQEIASLRSEMDQWAERAMLAGLAPSAPAEEPGPKRKRLILSFQYHSAKLLICRPCLCRIDRRIHNQSEGSANFNQQTAEACIEAAQSLTALFPDRPDLSFIYQQCPWWCIVHNIMQAIAVFLLELSFGAIHMTHNVSEISGSVHKLVRLLLAMSASNPVAERAYKVVVNIIKSGAPRVQVDIADILAEDARLERSHASSNIALRSRPREHSEESYFPERTAKAISLDPIPPTSPSPEPQQRPQQDPNDYQLDEWLTLDADRDTLSLFGNPFSTEFDDKDLLGDDLFSRWVMPSPPGPERRRGVSF